MTIRVLFGTETGNAEDCAYQLGDALEEQGFTASVTDMASFQPSDLAKERLAIVVTSTYGNGDPPYNAEAMMKWLNQPDSAVPGVAFAVCGLGDQTYPKFGQAGKDFDRLIEERGGRRIVPRVDCDVDYEEPFEQFMESVLQWLSENGDTLDADSGAVASAGDEPAHPEVTAAIGTRSAPVRATLRSRRRLNREGSAKETMHYEFEWPDHDVAFQAGDSFALIPENNPQEVAAVLAALNIDASASVTVGDESCSVRDALMTTRDLQVVTEELLALLLSTGTNPSVGPDAAAYLGSRHLVDVLRDTSDASIHAQALVDGLRRLKPRLYSVASSPLAEPRGVHFTVETLRYNWNGHSREGVATTWLADRFNDGDSVPMYCVQAPHFRLPDAAGVPVIMVGPGTGVAPFRAFLQERRAKEDPGEAWLFFGHQHAATDYLYEDEIEAWRADGTLNRASFAWSRDQAEKVYVQDKIRENGADIWAWIEAGAYMYVCGDKNAMAPQVRDAFITIAVTHGGHGQAEAEALFDGWEQSGRYCVDAY